MQQLACKNVFGGVALPMRCDQGGAQGPGGAGGEDCGPNPYVIMADQCEYIDQQTLKLQEAPEVVPTGTPLVMFIWGGEEGGRGI